VQHPADEALGRRRGGLTTKLPLSCAGQGRPRSVLLRAGQGHERPRFAAVLEAIRVPRPGGRGRPRPPPERVIADKGYSYARCRPGRRRRGIKPTIPARRDQPQRRTHRPGCRPACDAALYKRRNVVERCINRRKQWRGRATRYEKRAVNYRALVVRAALMIWLAD
jgi:transposase